MNEPLPLLPQSECPRRCEACGRLVPKGPLRQGLGSGCAREQGVTASSLSRLHPARQEGESLFDLLRVDAHRVGGNPGVEECPELRGKGVTVNEMIEWLNGVLDRRENAAHEAGGPDARWRRDLASCVVDDANASALVVYGDGRPSPEQADHIAFNDPAQILDDVSADRAILTLHARSHECSTVDQHGEVDNCTWLTEEDMCTTLRLIASKYATWPGYQPEWAPEAARG
ncbi:DUF6221 family protein [Micromonospora sediminicola]|uniref:DUF6221 family protein n=1 Tax=Micromonospora sediminicola TaxID=946078 RepID=UPI0037AEB2DA